jgi:hypothetical protein
MPYTPPPETLAATASLPISKSLAARVVLAHSHTMFHPCTCGHHGGAATVAATIIGYDNRGGCCWETREEETIVIDYFLYTDA